VKVTAADCLRCGLCCIAPFEQDTFCDVTPDDARRLGAAWSRKNVRASTPYEMLVASLGGIICPHAAVRTKIACVRRGPLAGHNCTVCTALNGEPMRQVRCAVYARRPEVCREAVKPNDRTCRRLREQIKSVTGGTK